VSGWCGRERHRRSYGVDVAAVVHSSGDKEVPNRLEPTPFLGRVRVVGRRPVTSQAPAHFIQWVFGRTVSTYFTRPFHCFTGHSKCVGVRCLGHRLHRETLFPRLLPSVPFFPSRSVSSHCLSGSAPELARCAISPRGSCVQGRPGTEGDGPHARLWKLRVCLEWSTAGPSPGWGRVLQAGPFDTEPPNRLGIGGRSRFVTFAFKLTGGTTYVWGRCCLRRAVQECEIGSTGPAPGETLHCPFR